MDSEAKDLIAILQEYSLALLWALVTFFIGKWLAKLVTAIARKTMEARKLDETIVKFLSNLLYSTLLVIVVLMAADELGIETTSVIAVLGAATLAIGLALQGSLANFAAGVMLIMFRQFRVGDFIDAGGVAGIVEEIRIFDTIMRTPDNRGIVVPNGQILGGPITNFSAKDTRRMDLVVGVSYDDDIRKVKAILTEIVANDPGTLEEPAPTIGLLEMADSSVNFAVRPWVNRVDYWDVFFRLQETIKLRLDEEGITIPYPQQDVYMHTVEKKAS
ncbi:mechanosensitive ion channel family protein [Cerasicoccus fimbriatus]|uniref:mechanosensitive ion channel family protein n=1 Tax=Cerasicoccus fimbriatus TaxID=3014554 RepID=UPI0022B413D4|nr:mechanosensitive ion channel domain-containing protein [Cerasicoccus sp. TK19100]